MHDLIILEMHDRLEQVGYFGSQGTACGRPKYGASTDQVPVSSSSAMANIPGLGLLWLKKPMQSSELASEIM